jgi:hypothetical protein
VKSDTQFEEWYFGNDRYRDYSIKCSDLLTKFENLKTYESRKHRKGDYVCWYVSFSDTSDEKICFIIRFEVRHSDICIYFQSSENVPKEALKHGEKADRHTGWLLVKYSNYRENELIVMIEGYLRNVKKNLLDVEKHCQKRRPCQNIKKKC